MTLRTYYFNQWGHHVPTEVGHYRMVPEWIDVDNGVWSEPYHLYGNLGSGISADSPQHFYHLRSTKLLTELMRSVTDQEQQKGSNTCV
jgi:hypothetical protein